MVEVACTYEALSEGAGPNYQYCVGYPDEILDQCEVLQPGIYPASYSQYLVDDEGKLIEG